MIYTIQFLLVNKFLMNICYIFHRNNHILLYMMDIFLWFYHNCLNNLMGKVCMKMNHYLNNNQENTQYIYPMKLNRCLDYMCLMDILYLLTNLLLNSNNLMNILNTNLSQHFHNLDYMFQLDILHKFLIQSMFHIDHLGMYNISMNLTENTFQKDN